ncbi:MAG: hypothetical protein NC452_21195, partial [Eubacterium sp.]|nr:hypothetical protein [Eubacterium sp.]
FSANIPQFNETIVELKTEDNTKLLEINVSELYTLNIALKPSKLTLKEFPTPTEGKYVDIFSEMENLDDPSEALKTLLNDIVEYFTENFIPEDVPNISDIDIAVD